MRKKWIFAMVILLLSTGCEETQKADRSFRVATKNPRIQAEWDAYKQQTGRDDELTVLAFNLLLLDRAKLPLSAVYKQVPDPNDPSKMIIVNRIDKIEKALLSAEKAINQIEENQAVFAEIFEVVDSGDPNGE